MRPTNYHLFDFLDFDPTLSKPEYLWKAYAPSKIEERDGDIVITIPYQRQKRQEDMAPDDSHGTDTDLPQQSFDLIVRAYEPGILRLFTTMEKGSAGDPPAGIAGEDACAHTDSSPMLQLSPEVKHLPLSLHPIVGEASKLCSQEQQQSLEASPTTSQSLEASPTTGYDICANGTKVATIDLSSPPLDHWSDLLPPPQPAPRITFYPDGDLSKPIALSDDHFSPPRYDALPLGFCSVCCDSVATNRTERATISFRCEPDECFVGTGERFRKMDLSGQSFYLKNQDGQGVNNRRCYKNIPFYLSSRLYGAFFHTSDYCKLSLADHSTRSVQFLNDRATLDVFLIGGDTPETILRRYRMLTGFPQMPPLWSFGIWMSRMTYFSAQEVEDICQRLRDEHYPCDVIHLDTGWFRTDWLCEWKFNPERFPDPEGFIHRLADKGFKVSLWQLPYIANGAEQLQEAISHHYISQDPTTCSVSGGNSAAQSNFSALDYAGTIDFTNPAATDWYKNKLLKPLLDMGVKCIKTDFGENIHTDHHYHNGMAPERLNNLYALLYQKAAWESCSDSPTPNPSRGGEGSIYHQAWKTTSELTGKITSSELTGKITSSELTGKKTNNELTGKKTNNEQTEVVTTPLPPAGGVGGGASRACIWARAAWAGCQRYPVHWGGDSESSWNGMAGSLKGGLHLGLSGFAFWSHDVPGFHSTPNFMNSSIDPKVYVRWTQFGVFTSHIRYHGTCKREPWHYPDIAPIVKRWWKLRYRLIPYIIQESQKACTSGLPVLQALLIKHPHDRQVWHIDDEYYFGDEFLVAPVMNSEDKRDIYLPKASRPTPCPYSPTPNPSRGGEGSIYHPRGTTDSGQTAELSTPLPPAGGVGGGATGSAWLNLFTGKRYEGGRWYYDIETPLDQIPVFVREGARIPLYPDDVDSTDDMDLNRTVILEIDKHFKGLKSIV